MYAIQRGTARDISLLVDFLPMYLFPEEEAEVDDFFVTGVSLGGEFMMAPWSECNAVSPSSSCGG
jgi:hypothetical protein